MEYLHWCYLILIFIVFFIPINKMSNIHLIMFQMINLSILINYHYNLLTCNFYQND